MIEAPDTYDKSIRVLEEDLERLRGVVGNSDAHRIRVICERMDPDDFGSYEKVGVSDDNVRMNQKEKDFIEELPGHRHVQQFHNFVRHVEECNSVDLRDSNNIVP